MTDVAAGRAGARKAWVSVAAAASHSATQQQLETQRMMMMTIGDEDNTRQSKEESRRVGATRYCVWSSAWLWVGHGWGEGVVLNAFGL